MLEDFEVPHTIQRHRVFEPQWYRWFGAQVRWAVNANRNDDGWNVNRNAVDNPNPWNVGNVLLSRNSFLSPASSCGSFRFKSFFPSANHATELIGLFGEKRV